MRWRWFVLFALAGAQCNCSLVTDFSGVSDGSGTGGSSSSGVGFPRLAIFETGNPKSFDDPQYEADASRFHVLIMGVYPGWGDEPDAIESTAKAIKALGTKTQTKVFVHVYPDHFSNASSQDAYQEVIDKLNDMNWWLYQSGTNGTMIEAPESSTQFMTNTTLKTPKDADGLTFIEWYPRYLQRTFLDPSPSLDGLETGYMSWKPRVSGDYDRDGTLDDTDDPQAATWYREGYAKYFADLKELAPNKVQLGDLTTFADKDAVHPELDGVMHGGFINRLIGETWSVESWGGWDEMMSHYRKGLAATIEPHLVVFDMGGTLDDYQTFRYGLTSCLMDDGYFAWDDEVFGVDWFDEYAVDLGAATTPPPTIPWKNGVYRRDFEHGIALVNPKGNGDVTLDLGASYTRISGTQDSLVNDGSTSSSVTLKDRDGIVLLKH